jgi:uncharacterized membrane protein YgcG
MRVDVALAERRHEVRQAAVGWQRAGVIDEATQAKIGAAYPDDRSRLGPAFRILVFGFTVVALTSFFGLFGFAIAAAGEGAAAAVVLLFGLALVAATELQIGPLRRTQGGTESATAFLGLCYLIGGLVWLMARARVGGDALVSGGLTVGTLVLASAAHRWGYVACSTGATIGVFLLLARNPLGRVSWVIVGAVTAPLLVAAADSVRLPPTHRRSCSAMAVASLVFLYLAVHVGSWDRGIVEGMAGHWDRLSRPAGSARPFFVIATALVPVATLVWGIAARRRLLINLAFVGVLASIVTLRVYVHLAPLWVALLAGGAVAIGLAIALRRYLDSGPKRERFGFTAEPLFGDPEARGALEVAAGVVSFSPGARPPERPGFEGGGGHFGGGGATGSF